MPSLPYLGGKSAAGPNASARWIARQLPPVARGQLYVEPFAGMCGILLQRPPANAEWINDLCSRTMNWWRVCRDRPADLERYLRFTPYAELEYRQAWNRLDSLDPVVAAGSYAVVIWQGYSKCLVEDSWHRVTNNNRSSMALCQLWHRIERLAERMRNVQLFNEDAVAMLERTARRSDSVIYCDPPYAHTLDYGLPRLDREALTEVLLRQCGAVAISGYGHEWNHLGWRSTKLKIGIGRASQRQGTQPRIATLWMNYPALEPEENLPKVLTLL